MLNQFMFIGTVKDEAKASKGREDTDNTSYYFKLIVPTTRKYNGWMNMVVRKPYLEETVKSLKSGDNILVKGIVRLTRFSKENQVLVPLFDIETISMVSDCLPESQISSNESEDEKIGF